MALTLKRLSASSTQPTSAKPLQDTTPGIDLCGRAPGSLAGNGTPIQRISASLTTLAPNEPRQDCARVLVSGRWGGQAVHVENVTELTERERALLDFEGSWWTLDTSKDELIRARFSCSLDEYYQELNRLVDVPAALAYEPLVVRRLVRLRDRRRRARLEGPAQVDDARGGTNV